MNRFFRLLVPLAVASLLACGNTQKLPPDVTTDVGTDARSDAETSRAELGTGQLSWEDLTTDGTHVELIHGPQGGYHVFGRVRFTGLSPQVGITFEVTPVEGGAPVNDPTDRIVLAEGRGLLPVGQAWETSNAQLVVLTTIHDPSPVVGRRFRFSVTVTSTATGESARDTRVITIVDKT